jgi:hypothetical protein
MTNHTIHFLSGQNTTGPILIYAVQGSGAGVGALVLLVRSVVVVLVAVVSSKKRWLNSALCWSGGRRRSDDSPPCMLGRGTPDSSFTTLAALLKALQGSTKMVLFGTEECCKNSLLPGMVCRQQIDEWKTHYVRFAWTSRNAFLCISDQLRAWRHTWRGGRLQTELTVRKSRRTRIQFQWNHKRHNQRMLP